MRLLTRYLDSNKIRYLIAGIWNTIFGYLCGVGVFLLLEDRLHIILIGIIANIIAISMAFFIYKKYVFKTHGNWVAEYFRCYTVYGFTSVVSIFLIWIAVDVISLNIWLAQGLVLPVVFLISYLGHNLFTFRK